MAVERLASKATRPTSAVDGWTDRALARLTALPDVARVGIALVEGGGRRLRFTASDRVRGSDLGWCHVDAYDDVPLNTAVRRREAVIAPIDGLHARYADFAAAQSDTAHVALAAVPLLADDDVLGGYVLFYDRAQAFDEVQRLALTDLGDELGMALCEAQRGHRRRPAVTASPSPAATGAREAVHDVPGESAAVGRARNFLRRTLAGWRVDEETTETAALCLSELVTNALVHAHGGCVVSAEIRGGELTVVVRDNGITGAAAVEPVADPMQVHGRGLQLVEALATRWGYDLDGDGASVWFALAVG